MGRGCFDGEDRVLGPASCRLPFSIQLHGRTRQQRYTKLADWDYIKYCVEAVRSREAEEDREEFIIECNWTPADKRHQSHQCPFLVEETAILLRITGRNWSRAALMVS